MFIKKAKQIIGLAALVATLGLGHASVTVAVASSTDEEGRRPALPLGCEHLAVNESQIVAAHMYAVGVQIYRWNGTTWAFVGPEANLYASKNYRGQVGTHYVGPTWESNSGSVVVGSNAIPCVANENSIPWLKLTAATTSGPGIFDGVTYIQRVNTQGGVRPNQPGTTIGEEARIPYTTEYYFYKQAGQPL
jgi:hypothetical protein